MQADLYMGRWQEVLADVVCDALIADPPYGARVHDSETAKGYMGRTPLNYDAWTPDDVRAFVAHWAPRTRGWMACQTSDDLIGAYREAYRAVGRMDFPPVPILQHRPRITGDGPGSGAVYLLVSRPRHKRFLGWGSLPCWYLSQPAKDGVCGGKPLELMRAIVADYSRPGELVCDPCAGGGTTLLASRMEGRRSTGAECKAEHFEIARRRLAEFPTSADGKQTSLFG